MQQDSNSGTKTLMKLSPKLLTQILIFVAVFSFMLGIISYILSFITYSSGYRDGYIQKVSNDGVIFKSVEMKMTDSKGTSPNVLWRGTIQDETTRELVSHIDNSCLVRVYYKEKCVSMPWQGSKCQVEKVETLAKIHVTFIPAPIK